MPAVQKGFESVLAKGPLLGFPVVNIRVVVDDGASHSVDSSEVAFQEAARGAWAQVYPKAKMRILEPIMRVVVEGPSEFAGGVLASLMQREGALLTLLDDAVVDAQPLPVSEEGVLAQRVDVTDEQAVHGAIQAARERFGPVTYLVNAAGALWFDRDASATGFHVGSRADFEAMNAFISGHRIRPVVDRVFDFDAAPEAFDFYINGDFMGKVVIRLDG